MGLAFLKIVSVNFGAQFDSLAPSHCAISVCYDQPCDTYYTVWSSSVSYATFKQMATTCSVTLSGVHVLRRK